MQYIYCWRRISDESEQNDNDVEEYVNEEANGEDKAEVVHDKEEVILSIHT